MATVAGLDYHAMAITLGAGSPAEVKQVKRHLRALSRRLRNKERVDQLNLEPRSYDGDEEDMSDEEKGYENPSLSVVTAAKIPLPPTPTSNYPTPTDVNPPRPSPHQPPRRPSTLSDSIPKAVDPPDELFQMYSHLDEEHDILYVLCRQAMQEALPRDVIKPSLLWDNADTALVVIGILLLVTLILSLFLSLFFDGLYVAFAAPTVWMTVLYIVRTPRRRREKEEARRQRLAKEKVDMLEDAKRACKAKLDDVTAKIKNRRYD